MAGGGEGGGEGGWVFLSGGGSAEGCLRRWGCFAPSVGAEDEGVPEVSAVRRGDASLPTVDWEQVGVWVLRAVSGAES